MPPPRIRLAEAQEAPEIRALVRAAYAPYVERIGTEPEPMNADYAALVEEGCVWVADDGGPGGVVGVIVLRPGEGHLLIENVAVAPHRQGEGVGRKLLTFAEGQAAAAGFGELRLYTNEKMRENLSLYSRLGYEETGRGAVGFYRRVFLRKRISPDRPG